ncbi:hypothetical protein FRUB_03144 [Fimbriiglobus ruber]|uniref:Uncharacterized protein n=1 Tax=Fimbriiglobus ruber TaxID=1908690 RepID=A0A225E4D1_9BACT|nr:hypothetical protein FRUB_03144 [Fimbriiglobus ruber]
MCSEAVKHQADDTAATNRNQTASIKRVRAVGDMVKSSVPG